MLIAKIYINETKIDEIHVQNVGLLFEPDIYAYKIRKPERDIMIPHVRKDGYKPLLRKVLEILDDNK